MGGGDKNKDKHTKGVEIRGERQSFQFLGAEKSDNDQSC